MCIFENDILAVDFRVRGSRKRLHGIGLEDGAGLWIYN